jgi:hypothetical protein
MVEYNIEVLSIYVAQSENGLNNVVKRVTWKYQAKEGSYAADVFKDTFFNSPDPSKYINYDNLKSDTIIDWIEEVENMEDIQSELNLKLSDIKDPSKVVEKSKPWEIESIYDYEDKYVLFHQGKMLVGGIFWRSETFNMYLKNVGLPESLPEDILARQRRIVPFKEPLIINEETDTKIYKCVILNEQSEDNLFQDNDYINWNLNVWPAEGTYQLINRHLEDVKQRLTDHVVLSYNAKENVELDIELQGTLIKIFTGIRFRYDLFEKYNNMAENDTIFFEFVNNKWLTISKIEIKQILSFIESYFDYINQSKFNIIQQINNATSVDELKTIKVE